MNVSGIPFAHEPWAFAAVVGVLLCHCYWRRLVFHPRALVSLGDRRCWTVHHLNDSRSQRILWLLEELELPYEIKLYQRDAVTRLAPPELKAVHPLGKSPVLTCDGATIIESGAIIDHVLRHQGAGRLMPAADSADYEAYVQWLHYAEGSAMLPLLMKMYTGMIGEGGAPLVPRIDSEIANHLGYLEASLEGRDWLVGGALSGADIQMSFRR